MIISVEPDTPSRQILSRKINHPQWICTGASIWLSWLWSCQNHCVGEIFWPKYLISMTIQWAILSVEKLPIYQIICKTSNWYCPLFSGSHLCHEQNSSLLNVKRQILMVCSALVQIYSSDLCSLQHKYNPVLCWAVHVSVINGSLRDFFYFQAPLLHSMSMSAHEMFIYQLWSAEGKRA